LLDDELDEDEDEDEEEEEEEEDEDEKQGAEEEARRASETEQRVGSRRYKLAVSHASLSGLWPTAKRRHAWLTDAADCGGAKIAQLHTPTVSWASAWPSSLSLFDRCEKSGSRGAKLSCHGEYTCEGSGSKLTPCIGSEAPSEQEEEEEEEEEEEKEEEDGDGEADSVQRMKYNTSIIDASASSMLLWPPTESFWMAMCSRLLDRRLSGSLKGMPLGCGNSAAESTFRRCTICSALRSESSEWPTMTVRASTSCCRRWCTSLRRVVTLASMSSEMPENSVL